MKVEAFKIDAFAKSDNGGNPAGVVLAADLLSDNDMKKIAGILGLSETAFVSNSDVADFKIRFFTPTEEVDLCGHATIGTFSILLNEGYVKPGKYTQETKVGILNVEVKEDLSIMMNQNAPSFSEILDKDEIAISLNINANEIVENLPVQIVSTGLRDIIIPVKNIEILNSIKPNFNKISEISKKNNSVGYHIFTLESLNNSTAHCRDLAPLYGIPEESATGTANGALACYLYKYNIINSTSAINLAFEQGYSMNMPSEILVSLTTEENNIIEVKVGGKSQNLSRIEVEI